MSYRPSCWVGGTIAQAHLGIHQGAPGTAVPPPNTLSKLSCSLAEAMLSVTTGVVLRCGFVRGCLARLQASRSFEGQSEIKADCPLLFTFYEISVLHMRLAYKSGMIFAQPLPPDSCRGSTAVLAPRPTATSLKARCVCKRGVSGGRERLACRIDVDEWRLLQKPVGPCAA